MTTEIVLISGKQGSGKTTLQRAIFNEWCKGRANGFHAFEMNFAEPLKYLCRKFEAEALSTFGIQGLPNGEDKTLQQLIGTEWGRLSRHPDIWVDALKVAVKNRRTDLLEDMREGYADPVKHLLFIIGDCRFENEFKAFPNEDISRALKIRLRCSEEIRKLRCPNWRTNTLHESEVGLDHFDDEGLFDMYFDTSEVDPAEIAKCVVDRLLSHAQIKSESNAANV